MKICLCIREMSSHLDSLPTFLNENWEEWDV